MIKIWNKRIYLELMDMLPLLAEHGEFHHGWTLQNITDTFLKCTRWQVEETADLISCPYHYSCDSSYVGDYPPIADYSVIFFTVSCYLSLTIFTVLDLANAAAGAGYRRSKRRYWLPSGPFALPLILLILAKGSKINAVLPISIYGPVLLQLVQISSLAFKNQTNMYITYAVLESSTISGVLHAALYLDSIILPFYTGLDVLMGSTFSGECLSCVCRRTALVIGGNMVRYRGWSATTMVVVCALCSRILCEIFAGERFIRMVKMVLEGFSWMMIAIDSIYLVLVTPQGGIKMVAAYAGIYVLVLLSVLRKVGHVIAWLAEEKRQTKSLIRTRSMESGSIV